MSHPARTPVPYAIPGIVGRWDASVASSIHIGTGVSQWDDLTGNGHNLLQATGGAQPTVSGEGILFNGTSQFLASSAFTLNQPETVYLVGQQVTWTNNAAVYDGIVSTRMQVALRTSSPIFSADAGSVVGNNSGWAVATTAVITCGFYGATVSFDRVNRLAAVTGSSGSNNGGGFTLGAIGGGGSAWSNILVFEVIIFNVAHTTDQQNQIIQYLGNKWGIAV